MKFSYLGAAVTTIALSLVGCSSSSGRPAAGPTATPIVNPYLTTATPYLAQQAISDYSPVPAGFNPVFTEAVVRHGSRGLSSFDATLWNMWQQAAADGSLTPLGYEFGADVYRIMKANALLDEGVAGITYPGFGNLSQMGIAQEQLLGSNMLQRLPTFFTQVAASAATTSPRQIVVETAGVVNASCNRVEDSAGFFTQSLTAGNSALASLLTPSAPLTAYPANKPVAQAAGVNRFLLYFNKLAAKTDLVTSVTDPYYSTYQASQAYEAYENNTNMLATVNGIATNAASAANASTVLSGLFTQDFLTKISNGTYTFSNTGTFTFTSDDGKYTVTETGSGGTPTVQCLTDAAAELYGFYQIVPGMANELNNLDFTKYVPAAQASLLAYNDDVSSYYVKGPGIQQDNPIQYTFAQVLLNDLFSEVDAIAAGNLAHGAVLRFTHAEEVIPLAVLLGLPNASVPTSNTSTYTYTNNPWRGNQVAPVAANVQWDVFSDGKGNLLVKMLYNEQETDFAATCDSARYAPGSHFYNYAQLKAIFFPSN